MAKTPHHSDILSLGKSARQMASMTSAIDSLGKPSQAMMSLQKDLEVSFVSAARAGQAAVSELRSQSMELQSFFETTQTQRTDAGAASHRRVAIRAAEAAESATSAGSLTEELRDALREAISDDLDDELADHLHLLEESLNQESVGGDPISAWLETLPPVVLWIVLPFLLTG